MKNDGVTGYTSQILIGHLVNVNNLHVIQNLSILIVVLLLFSLNWNKK